MKKLSLFFISFFVLSVAIGQPVKKGNPIIYVETVFGGAGGKGGGVTGGAELNYQIKHSLLTLRYISAFRTKLNVVYLTPITPFIIPEESTNNNEYSALYGYRFIVNGHSISFSGGISHTYFRQYYKENNQTSHKTSDYFGMPLEANIKWFKKDKSKFKIYGILPIGPPTSFGGSIGIKLFANISQNNTAGLGLTYGLGYHKKY